LSVFIEDRFGAVYRVFGNRLQFSFPLRSFHAQDHGV
jgi:hypothetical protein